MKKVDICVMEENSEQIGTSGLLASLIERSKQDLLEQPSYYQKKDGFVHFLAWEASSLRIFIEVVAVFIAYQILNSIFVIQGFVQVPLFIHICLIAVLSLGIIFLDNQIFCKGVKALQQALKTSFRGDVDKAILQLKSSLKCLLPPSSDKYNLVLSEFHILNGDIEKGDLALERALKAGVSPYECVYLRMRSLFYADKFDENLEEIKPFIHNSPIMQLDYGIISLVSEETYHEANKIFNLVLEQESDLHPSGTETHDLTRLMKNCIKLRNGNSDEALTELKFIFDSILPELKHFPDLRPYIAIAILLRAEYFSNKKNYYKNAKFDIERALSVCSYPLHCSMADRIKENIRE